MEDALNFDEVLIMTKSFIEMKSVLDMKNMFIMAEIKKCVKKVLFWLSQILGTPKVGVHRENLLIGNVFLGPSIYVGTMSLRILFQNSGPIFTFRRPSVRGQA